MPMQYTEIFKVVKKMKIFSRNFSIFFPPKHRLSRRGGSNEYPKSVFWSKNKKKEKTVIPLPAPVYLYKSGVQGGILFMDMFS